MKYLRFHQTLGLILSFSLISEPLFAAYAPVSSAMDAGATAASNGGEFGVPSATPVKSASDASSVFNTTSIAMNALPLPKTAISMDFQEAEVRDVMHLMAVKSGINIIYGADVTGPVTIHLDRVPFDQAFQTVLTLKGLVALRVGPRIIRVVSSTGLSTEQSQAATFTKVFVLKYSIATDIKGPLDAIRSAAGRKGVSSVDIKNNALIITDTIEGLKEVEELIPTIDRKPQQVDIEAKIVEVILDDETKLGISWAFARSAGGGNKYGGTVDNTDTSIGFYGTDATLTGNSFDIQRPNIDGLPATGVDFSNALGTLGQSAFSFLHAEQAYLLSAQLTALASKGKTKVLSTPHIVALNNTDATIHVTTQNPYQTSTIANNQTTISVAFSESGVKLTVRPTVNADRRITLKVTPEVSNTTSAPPRFAGAPPAINSRRADTTVLLRDGETIAIGGLIAESTFKGVVGIPILMSIPIIGWLFKGKEDRLQRTELIVFLTPRIAAE